MGISKIAEEHAKIFIRKVEETYPPEDKHEWMADLENAYVFGWEDAITWFKQQRGLTD